MNKTIENHRVTVSCKNLFDESNDKSSLLPASSRRHIHENINNRRSNQNTPHNVRPNKNIFLDGKQSNRTVLNPLSPVFHFPKSSSSEIFVPSISETSDYSSGTDPEQSIRNLSPEEKAKFSFELDLISTEFQSTSFRRNSISSCSSSSMSNLSSISSGSNSRRTFSTRLNNKRTSMNNNSNVTFSSTDRNEKSVCFCDKENLPARKKFRRTATNLCSNCQSKRWKNSTNRSNRTKFVATTKRFHSPTNSSIEFSIDLTGLKIDLSIEYHDPNRFQLSTPNFSPHFAYNYPNYSFCKCSTLNDWNSNLILNAFTVNPTFLYDCFYSDGVSPIWLPSIVPNPNFYVLNELVAQRFQNEQISNCFFDERLPPTINNHFCFFTPPLERDLIQRAPKRSWLRLSAPNKKQPTGIFTVINYNILCDRYATRHSYGYCPSWALKWEYRRKQILEELRSYSADIIALQEIETDQFYLYFLPELKTLGYDGIFSPKSRAKTMCEEDRRYVDGCAIFYRQSKFRLIEDYLVEFNQLAMSAVNGSSCHDTINRVTTKDNIGLVALLETKEDIVSHSFSNNSTSKYDKQLLFVCTAHIHWDPEYSDVKVVQTLLLLSKLNTIMNDAIAKYQTGMNSPTDCSKIPLVLCGDFNSLPDSGVVELMCTGKISMTHADFKDLRYESFLKKVIQTDTNSDASHHLVHPFKLQSAYETTASPIMPYTNYTYDFKGIIDYVFYSSQVMQVLGVLGPLDPEWIKMNKIVGCPHPSVPSDHFPLLVEFELSPNEHQSSSTTNQTKLSSKKRKN